MNFSTSDRMRACAVVLSVSFGIAAFAQSHAAAEGSSKLPSGYSLAGTGGRDDFAFLTGAWTTQQRQLKQRHMGSTEWKDGPSNVHCATQYLNGVVTAEESYSATKGVSGLFLYSFDLEKHQWTLYWIDPKSGKFESPLVGGFVGSHGEFYGEDVDDGRPIKVRYSWLKKDQDHARWEQAFSYDNQNWETNWTAEFARADPAQYCAKRSLPPAVPR